MCRLVGLFSKIYEISYLQVKITFLTLLYIYIVLYSHVKFHIYIYIHMVLLDHVNYINILIFTLTLFYTT
jgi:hypothetical protein